MFLGEFIHNLDDKGRLTIPAKFRNELAAGVVVTRGFDRNLMLFPIQGWMALADEIAKRPLGDEDMRAFRRRLFSGAMDIEPDKQGRIVLPPYLRQFAGINTEIVVAGMHHYIELWNVTAWELVRTVIESSDDAARWDDLGI